MKQNLKLIMGVACISIFAMIVVYQTYFHTSSLGSLLLENIEALAGGESGGIGCIGRGTVDCPINHAKVSYVVGGYALE